MENLFYECEITNKFDLKGSDRNRLVDPTNQNGEIVLLDENLIQSKFSIFNCTRFISIYAYSVFVSYHWNEQLTLRFWNEPCQHLL